MDSRRVFGSTLRCGSQLVECYERIHTGLGDGVMLRPAIIGNMERYPDRKHILHIYANVAPVFSDIKGLEIVPIMHPDHIIGTKRQTQYRYNVSLRKISTYKIGNVYELSTPCADYEVANSPFESIIRTKTKHSLSRYNDYFPTKLPRLVRDNIEYQYAVPTGKRIVKSRQRIFCETVGVPFSVDNYSVIFSDYDLQNANDFLKNCNMVVGMQIRTSTPKRDYNGMIRLAEHVATKVDAVVLTDKGYAYKGRAKNVISLRHGVRESWAIISMCDMFIGADSFGVHAAGSVGVPTYGIFGPTDPECRLSDYSNAAWSDKWQMPIARRLFKRGCGRQYCWYKPCGNKGCMNARSPEFYWNDAIEKLKPGV